MECTKIKQLKILLYFIIFLFKKLIISECKNEYGVTNESPLKESVKQEGSKVAKVFSTQAVGVLSSPPWACGQRGHLSL